MFDSSYKFTNHDSFKAHSFFCMGGLCEILIDTTDKNLSTEIFTLIYTEAKRIEAKFSRYNKDNIVFKINQSGGKKIKLDKETAKLIHYADKIFTVSNGLFDITSGVLRRLWTFDQSSKAPKSEDIKNLLPFIGWDKVTLEKKSLTIPKGFELDLGGIGKEYAVDSCVNLCKQHSDPPCLINFGGDIAVTGAKANNLPWSIGIEDGHKTFNLFHGGLATSGDKNKFILSDGKKLSHILNPKTGWPVSGGPTSITVVADTCTAAGTISTLAFLNIPDHESFLEAEASEYFIF